MRVAVESFATCWNELVALAQAHFTSLGRAFRPARERYEGLEAEGYAFAVTARDGGRLVGFAVMYAFPSMHDQSINARDDFFYVSPAYRGRFVWRRLLRAVEDECARRGCEEVTMTTETGSMAGAILSAVGYGKVSENHRLKLVRADSPSTERAVA